MDRRSALRNFVIVSAGFVLLPRCKDGQVKGTVSLKNIQLSGDEELLLMNLSQTILPVKDEGAHLFVLTMVDDCYAPADQQKFIEGLKQFDKSFVQMSKEEKYKLLSEMEGKKDAKEAVNYFYNTTRSLTLQHYTSSKDYMVNVRKFEMVPGRFNGCFPIQKKSV